MKISYYRITHIFCWLFNNNVSIRHYNVK